MSHQTGIQVSQPLAEQWHYILQKNETRYVQVLIEDEEMVAGKVGLVSASRADDWKDVQAALSATSACYVAFRVEPNLSTSAQWVLCLYVPDTAPVKDKMLYASTKETLKKELGFANFVSDLFASDASELSEEAWVAAQEHEAAEAPMTETEVAFVEEALMEKDLTQHTHVHSVQFPLSGAAKVQLMKFKSGSPEWIEMWLETGSETVELGDVQEKVDFAALAEKLSDEEPRFFALNFSHTRGGAAETKKIFVYYCPDNSSVKLRMVYSTCKGAVVTHAETHGVTFDKTLEVRSADDLTKEAILEELYPAAQQAVKVVEKPAFSKPSRPGKGAARLKKKHVF